MMLYLKCFRLFALHAEWSRALSARPLFKIIDCNGERIFDMPYGRVIFTPDAGFKHMDRNEMGSEIKHFIGLLHELQKIDPEFPLQYALCLAEISQDEGLSLTHLAKRTGMPLSTVSRIVGALSRRRQSGRPYGLVSVSIAARERRRKELRLTAQGRDVVHSIAKILH